MNESSDSHAGAEQGGSTESAGLRIAREFWLFVVSPRVFVRGREADWRRPVRPLGVLVACLGVVAVLMGLYRLAFGPLLGVSEGASAVGSSPVDGRESAPASIVDWGFQPGFGLQVILSDEGVPISAPQRVRFTVGFGYVDLDGVVPEQLGSGAFPVLGLLLFALVTALCLYLPVRLWGGRARFRANFDLSLLLYAYLSVATVTLFLLGMVPIEVFGFPAPSFRRTALGVLTTVPLLAILLRGFLLGFGELHHLPKWKIALSSLGAIAMSILVFPVVFIPGVYLLIRFQSLFDLFL